MTDLDCRQAAPLVDAALDDELDVLTRMAFDRHLAGCPACAQRLAARSSLSGAIRARVPHYAPPARLEKRLLAALPGARPVWRRSLLWAMSGAVSGAALAASLLLALPLPSPGLQDDLISAHLRSLIPDHLTDVTSTDQHTVKPWFQGRLALSPPVPDLASRGFPLVGGRLDYVRDHPAAALVYRHRQHVINLFVWTAPEVGDQAPRHADRNGYQLVEWARAGLRYSAVSDVNAEDLELFQRLWSEAAFSNAKD